MSVSSPSPQLLLIHDQKTLSKDYNEFFKNTGWQFDLVSDSSKAVDTACSNDYDIIITDLDLPGIQASEFLKKVHELKPNQAVMVISSLGNAEKAIKALKTGAIDFLQKPLDHRFLHEAIIRIMMCLQDGSGQYKLLKSLKNYRSVYEFRTGELGGALFVPPILDRLYRAGIVDLNSKLKIALAFQEALANSIEHGNLELASTLKDQFDKEGLDLFTVTKEQRLADVKYSERMIYIESLYNEGTLSFSIKDQGIGFKIPETGTVSIADESMLLCYGRGLRIIFGTMDQVLYEDSGTKITITKKLF